MHIIDGGLASTLVDYGHDINTDVLWSARLLATNPQAIIQVHKDFYSHGADVATTASYQASVDGLCSHLDVSLDEAVKLIRSSVTLAKRAREEVIDGKRKLLIAGSVGPYGACLHDGSEYTGSYINSCSQTFLKEWHRPRLELLIEEGVDLLAIETQPSLEEVLCIADLLKEHPNTKAWISFSCKNSRVTGYGDDFGLSVVECYKRCKGQLVGVGINCSSPVYVAELLEQAEAAVKAAKILAVNLVVYPNSGEEWSSDKGWYGGDSCKSLSSYVPEWLKYRVDWIGGCCRTSPSCIQQLRDAVNQCIM